MDEWTDEISHGIELLCSVWYFNFSDTGRANVPRLVLEIDSFDRMNCVRSSNGH